MAKKWKPRAGEKELLEQIRIAARQLDDEPGGRLGWIVRFVREQPDQWLPGERDAHGHRLLALVHQLPPNLIGGTTIARLASRDVVALHADLSKGLHELLTMQYPEVFEVPTEGLRTVILRPSAPGARHSIFAKSHSGPFRTMLWQKVADLVFSADRLASCPTCARPFLALRKKMFCEPKCAERWHDRKKIEKKKARVGR